MPQPQQVQLFHEVLERYYLEFGRDLPWRISERDGTFDPYKIWVSEVMLQQTQVSRVVPKYQQFLEHFPDVATLATASLQEVLDVWQGLGYSRRARYLRESAIVLASKDTFPSTEAELVALPGVGINTARAILVYAYNQPHAFVETNVRTVYLYHFFKDQEGVSDTELVNVVDATLDRANPREFYWSLMDYGTHLKQTEGNHSVRSKHYKKQATFEGSERQLRGKVLRLLAAKSYTNDELMIALDDPRLDRVIAGLVKDGLVAMRGSTIEIAP